MLIVQVILLVIISHAYSWNKYRKVSILPFVMKPTVKGAQKKIIYTILPVNLLRSVEDGINLSLLNSFPQEGKYLSDRIRTWLDKEYIPQDIHTVVGKEVEIQYIRSRSGGVDDLGSVMMDVGTHLETINMREAFVNAWDVANKVSDLLIVLLDRELCGCAGNMEGDYQAAVDYGLLKSTLDSSKSQTTESFMSVELYFQLVERYSSEFNRYRVLRDFLEGEIPWKEIQFLMEIMLGCRPLAESSKSTTHNSEVAPMQWQLLTSYPNFHATDDEKLGNLLRNDLPKDENDIDTILEMLMGLEHLKNMKQKGDEDIQRRMLVVQWLYTHGFVDEEFPPVERFIPGHILSEKDDDEWTSA